MRLDGLLERLEAWPGLKRHRAAVEEFLSRSADPEGVVVGLLRLHEAGADPESHLGGWMRLIDVSPVAVETLAMRPALAAEIPSEHGKYRRHLFEGLLDEQLSQLPSLEERLEYLREVRVDETLRIAWQDLVEGADLTVITRRISDLAEIMMERVLREVDCELAGRFGRPWHESEPVSASVIAMGKLGGAELNYSSDIDLIFLYSKDGTTDGGASGKSISNREYFHRLTEWVAREANAITPKGRLYRVDLRLRPEGASGSLARSLAATIAYYRRMGETWERQAMLKARVIAGDRRLGQEFVDSTREWVFGRGLDFAAITSLKHIKQRIERRTRSEGAERTEIKLGYGGIRDVEYVIQFLQLLHGARHPDLRHHNSLTALRLLEGSGAILPEERDLLDDAYRFLRLVEHRLQLVQHAQVHRIPDDEAGLRVLARRCGYPDAESFQAEYLRLSEGVRSIFDRLFRRLFEERDELQIHETNLLLGDIPHPEALSAVLKNHGIRNIESGIASVQRLCSETSGWLSGSPRTRKFFADLFPRLLDAVSGTADPDAALRRLEAITERVGARATLYEAMGSDRRLLGLLVDLAGSSAFLSNILVRSPGTLDQLVDAVATEPDRGLASFEDIPTATVPTAPDPAGILNDYKQLEMLRIGLRDVRGEQGVAATGEDLTRLAEVVLRLAYERARREVRTAGDDLVTVALGRLGAGEMLFGSDLDVVFLTRESGDRTGATNLARRLHALLGATTDHGRLYEVDLRLRPGGSAGPLVATPAGFRHYFARGIGQTWERMSYTRARIVAGPPALGEEILKTIHQVIYAPGFSATDARFMAEMRGKMAAASAPDSVKRSGAGGVVDIEFVAQMHALDRGRDDPRYRIGNVTGILGLLRDDRVLHPQRAADLIAAHHFLLALEAKIRIVTDLSADRLPDDPQALRALARRRGYVDTSAMSAEDALREEYEYHREVAARAFGDAVRAFGADQ